MTRRGLWIALAALIVFRLAVVVSLGDVFGYGEEFTKGAAAKAMLDGLPIDHHRLAYGYHEGGGFAVTHLKALIFLVIGPSVLAHKIAALILACALLTAIVIFAREHLGESRAHETAAPQSADRGGPRGASERSATLGAAQADARRAAASVDDGTAGRVRAGELAAWIAAAFFVLAPTNFVRFSLLNLGTHFEAQIFWVLVLHFTLRLVRGPTGRSRDALCLGLAAGFGLYFSLTILPALAASAIWIVASRRARVFGRETVVALAGFAVGALPLWIMMACIGKEAVVVGGHEATTGFGPFVAALKSIPGPVLRSGDPWVFATAASLLAAVVYGLVSLPRRAHGIVAATIALYTLAYGVSGFALEYDPRARGAWFFLLRLVPFWSFGLLLAAHGVAVLWTRGGVTRRVLAASATAVVVLSGARDVASSCAHGRPENAVENLAILARTKGYVFPEYFDKMHEHVGGDRNDSVRVLGAYDEDPRRLLPALTQSVFDHWKDTPEAAVEACRGWFGADARHAWRGLGRVMHPNWVNDVPAAFARLETMPEDAREPLAEALGRTPLFPYFLGKRLEEAVAQDVPPRWRDAWLRGVGWRAFHTFPYRPDLAEAFLASRPESERGPLRAGYEEARELETLR